MFPVYKCMILIHWQEFNFKHLLLYKDSNNTINKIPILPNKIDINKREKNNTNINNNYAQNKNIKKKKQTPLL